MNKVLKNSWALFTGMGFLMMAYGFQGSLLGVRAVAEEFSLMATGFMMSARMICGQRRLINHVNTCSAD